MISIDYFKDQKYRAEYWEDWSLIRNDEAPEIFGHMQGLSIGIIQNKEYLYWASKESFQ